MKRLQSPTLLVYILIGFIIVSLPLIASIVIAIKRVDRLAEENRETIITVQQNAVTSRGLVERAASMERSARQYQALNDPSYKKLYDEHREGARQLLDQIGGQAGNPEMEEALASFSESERNVTALVHAPLESFRVETLEAELDALRRDTMAVLREQNTISRSMADVMSEKAQRLRKGLVAQAFFVIPVSACLMGLLFLVIAPPIRQIRESIRELGRGSLGTPIHVRGARDLEELGMRLEWLRTRLVELQVEKSQFLRNVSHELKTPLTNIREGAELLLEDGRQGSRDDTAMIAQIVQSNSVRLHQMIETLLKFGAEGDGSAGQAQERVRLDQVVMDLVERHAPDAAAYSIGIVHDLEEAEVLARPKRLQIIVENLLSNALKYTPRKGQIGIRLRRKDGVIELDVSDTGPGVAEKDRSRIFEWFYTGPRPPGAVVSGTGMGLAIAREYAEQLGGHLECLPSSMGARFRLTLRKVAS